MITLLFSWSIFYVLLHIQDALNLAQDARNLEQDARNLAQDVRTCIWVFNHFYNINYVKIEKTC